jgi:hypothetical protein
LNRTFLSIPQLGRNFSRKAGARASTDILLMPTLAKMPQPLINDSKIAQTTAGQPTHVLSMRAGQPVQSTRMPMKAGGR